MSGMNKMLQTRARDLRAERDKYKMYTDEYTEAQARMFAVESVLAHPCLGIAGQIAFWENRDYWGPRDLMKQIREWELDELYHWKNVQEQQHGE